MSIVFAQSKCKRNHLPVGGCARPPAMGAKQTELMDVWQMSGRNVSDDHPKTRQVGVLVLRSETPSVKIITRMKIIEAKHGLS